MESTIILTSIARASISLYIERQITPKSGKKLYSGVGKKRTTRPKYFKRGRKTQISRRPVAEERPKAVFVRPWKIQHLAVHPSTEDESLKAEAAYTSRICFKQEEQIIANDRTSQIQATG